MKKPMKFIQSNLKKTKLFKQKMFLQTPPRPKNFKQIMAKNGKIQLKKKPKITSTKIDYKLA